MNHGNMVGWGRDIDCGAATVMMVSHWARISSPRYPSYPWHCALRMGKEWMALKWALAVNLRRTGCMSLTRRILKLLV